MKPIGILFDNISRNTGDVAIGLSVQKILKDLGYPKNMYREIVPGLSNPSDYRTIIIGGGLLLRERGDFFYDKFRLKGDFILNSMGVLGQPKDLSYLNYYRYLSVRSVSDSQKLNYLANSVKVTPCTTLLLDDTPIPVKIEKPSIGIHCFSRNNFKEITSLIHKYSTDYHIYLLPITFYNYDYEFMEMLYSQFSNNKRVHLLPILSPNQVFSTIGQFNFFISYSLHGAMFAYRHQVPFLLLNNIHDDKMSAFMADRKLDQWLFTQSQEIDTMLSQLITAPPDYTLPLKQDFQSLADHKKRIKNAIEHSNANLIYLSSKHLKTRIKELRDDNCSLQHQISRINTSLLMKINTWIHALWPR